MDRDWGTKCRLRVWGRGASLDPDELGEGGLEVALFFQKHLTPHVGGIGLETG